VDLLVDFDAIELSAATTFAEDVCRQLELKADIKPKSFCTESFIRRIAHKAVVLP
jgi:hypothetical protein